MNVSRLHEQRDVQLDGQLDGKLNGQIAKHCLAFDRQLNGQVGAGKGTRSQGSRMLALQL